MDPRSPRAVHSAGAIVLTLVLAATPPAGAAPAADAGPTDAAPSQNVVVSATRLNVESRIDRKIYTIKGDLQSTFGTVGDVLQQIPSVDVDADGAVSLRGDSNVVILIDGKPSPQFAGASAGDAIQSIPAQDIERIEVMTSPPPEYRAEGTAGVINIVTRRRRAAETAGMLQASRGSEGRYLYGFSGETARGPWSARASGSYRQDRRRRESSSELATADPAATTQTLLAEHVNRAVPVLRVGVQYAPDEHQSLALDVGATGRGGLRTYTRDVQSSGPDGTPVDAARRYSHGHDRSKNFDAKLAYTRELGTKDDVFSVSLHGSRFREVEHYDYVNVTTLPVPGSYDDNYGFDDGERIAGADVDLTRHVGAGRLRVGASTEQHEYDYAARGNFYDPVTGIETPKPAMTDDFRYRRRVDATYATWLRAWGPWSTLLGARVERTTGVGRQLTLGLTTEVGYTDVFPSLRVERDLGGDQTLSFGAGRRIARPDPELLNPFVDSEYAPSLSAGNARLRPEYVESLELGFASDGGTFGGSVDVYLRRQRDAVTEFVTALPDGSTLTSKANLPTTASGGLEFSTTGRVVRSLGYTVSGNLFHQQVDASALGGSAHATATGVNLKLRLDWRLGPGDAAQAALTRTDRRLTPQGEVGAVTLVNLGLKHQLAPRLSLVATVSDAFQGQRYVRTAATPTLVSRSERFVHGRVGYLGLVVELGGKQKKAKDFDYDP
jgi:outer membrane cobalamin receptor